MGSLYWLGTYRFCRAVWRNRCAFLPKLGVSAKSESTERLLCAVPAKLESTERLLCAVPVKLGDPAKSESTERLLCAVLAKLFVFLAKLCAVAEFLLYFGAEFLLYLKQSFRWRRVQFGLLEQSSVRFGLATFFFRAQFGSVWFSWPWALFRIGWS
jgi:hypothetical protein